MALSTDILLGVPYNVGGTLREVDASTVVDNVFTFSSNGKKWQRVFDGGNSVYRASWLSITGAPTSKAALMAIIIANAAIQTIEIDTDVNLGTTNVNFQGKRLQFKNGGTISGTSATINNAIISADYSTNIINAGVSLTSCLPSDGEWSVKWFGATGLGVVSDSVSVNKTITISAASTAKTIIFPYGTYLLSSNLDGNGIGIKFYYGAMITGDVFVTNVTGIYASMHQQIFSTSIKLIDIYTDGFFSVKWTGAKGDGVTDDTAAFAACNVSTNIRCRSMLIPRSTAKYILNGLIAVSNPLGGATTRYRSWTFENGALLGGTVTISNITILADKNSKIADDTITFSGCRPDGGLWSVAWQADDSATRNNQTVAFTKANTACAQKYTIYVPSGEWKIDGPIIDTRMVGEGRGTTLTYSPTGTTGAILQIGRHTALGDTGLIEIGNFAIIGTGAVGVSGLRFDPAQIFAGRYRFVDISFLALKKGVEKTGGNFGNVFDGCQFSGVAGQCDFHYYAHDDPNMHAGLDTFINCRFTHADLAAVYIFDAEGGGTTFDKCVFEYNYGFDVFFAFGGYLITVNPYVFRNCWIEGNVKNFPVTIDSVVYSQPYEFYFNRVNQAILENCTLGRMSLNNYSYVKVQGGSVAYAVGQVPTDVDATSYLEVTESVSGITTLLGANYQTNGVSYSPQGISTMRANFPSKVVNNYSVNLKSFCDFFIQNEVVFTGAGITKIMMNDGITFPKTMQFSNFSGATNITNLTYSTTINKWYVSSGGFKMVSGTRAVISQTGTDSALTISTDSGVKFGEWTYWYAIRFARTSTSVSTQIAAGTSSDAVFNLSAFQVLEFDTYAQAALFVKENVYVSNKGASNKYTIRGSMTGATAVTIPDGMVVTNIILSSSSTQIDLLIGSTPGGSDFGSASFTGGAGNVIQVGIYGTGSNSVNFSNITGTVNYRINLEY